MADKPSLKNGVKTVLTKTGRFFKGLFAFVKQKAKSAQVSRMTLEEFCRYANSPSNFASNRDVNDAFAKAQERFNLGDFEVKSMVDGVEYPAFEGDKNNQAEVEEYINRYVLQAELAKNANVAKRTAEFLSTQIRELVKLVEQEDENISLVEYSVAGKIIGGKLAPALKRLVHLEAKMSEVADPFNIVKEIELERHLKHEMKDVKYRSALLDKVEKKIKEYNKQISILESESAAHKKLNQEAPELETENNDIEAGIAICEDVISRSASSMKNASIFLSNPWLDNIYSERTQAALQKDFNAIVKAREDAFVDKKAHKLIEDPKFETPSPYTLAQQITHFDKNFVLIKNNVVKATEKTSYKPDGEEMGFMLLTKSQVKFLDRMFKQAVNDGTFNGNGAKSFTDAGIATKFKFFKEILAKTATIDWNDPAKAVEAEINNKGIAQFRADDAVVTHVMEQAFREDLAGALTLRVMIKTKQKLEKQKVGNESAIISKDVEDGLTKERFNEAQKAAIALQIEIAEAVREVQTFDDDELDYFGKRTTLEGDTTLAYHAQELANKDLSSATIDSDKDSLKALHQAQTADELKSCFDPYREKAKVIKEAADKISALKASHSVMSNERISDADYYAGIDKTLVTLIGAFKANDPFLKKLGAHIDQIKAVIEVLNTEIRRANELNTEGSAKPEELDEGILEVTTGESSDAENEGNPEEGPVEKPETVTEPEVAPKPETTTAPKTETAPAEPRTIDKIEKDIAKYEEVLKGINHTISLFAKTIRAKGIRKLPNGTEEKYDIKELSKNLDYWKKQRAKIKANIKELKIEVKLAKTSRDNATTTNNNPTSSILDDEWD